jgi:hypothetical protein
LAYVLIVWGVGLFLAGIYNFVFIGLMWGLLRIPYFCLGVIAQFVLGTLFFVIGRRHLRSEKIIS